MTDLSALEDEVFSPIEELVKKTEILTEIEFYFEVDSRLLWIQFQQLTSARQSVGLPSDPKSVLEVMKGYAERA